MSDNAIFQITKVKIKPFLVQHWKPDVDVLEN